MPGFTRQLSGYNPLDASAAEKDLSGTDTWICVAPGATFRKAPRKDAELAQEKLKENGKPDSAIRMSEVPVGAELHGTREGDWLKLAVTNNYVLVKDGSDRYFKNKRVILWEESQGSDAITRRPSVYSNDSGDKPKKKSSAGSNGGKSDSNCSVM
eukprot:TRINITY_DN17793_c0_g1_i1.p1 TRINITY_DN17793_c0_g1~~TRINITY_DN17793_c0_g1_i1.p1  ORF type:complete len:155 (-),score=30.19 TRINITY_DN17793_c0_g1_i1:186-650(-)